MERRDVETKYMLYNMPNKREKDLAALGYIWVLGLIIYFVERDSEYIHFHAKQSIVLFLLSIPLAAMPFIGQWLLFIIVGAEIYGFTLATNGKKDDIPIIGQCAKGNASLKKIWLDIADMWRKGKNTLTTMIIKIKAKTISRERKKITQESEKEILKPSSSSPML